MSGGCSERGGAEALKKEGNNRAGRWTVRRSHFCARVWSGRERARAWTRGEEERQREARRVRAEGGRANIEQTQSPREGGRSGSGRPACCSCPHALLNQHHYQSGALRATTNAGCGRPSTGLAARRGGRTGIAHATPADESRVPSPAVHAIHHHPRWAATPQPARSAG